MGELKRRFSLFKGQLIKLIVDEDALGLRPAAAHFEANEEYTVVNTYSVGANAFCPTGQGGGHDNSCGRDDGGGGSGSNVPNEKARSSAFQKLAKAKDVPPPPNDPKALADQSYVKPPLTTVSSPELDNRMRSAIASKTPKSVELDTDDLVATQSAVRRSSVEHMIREAGNQKYVDEDIVVVRIGGRNFIHDGHHRATARKLLGQKTVKVKLYQGSGKVPTFNTRWAFRTTPQQLKAFQEWLKTQIKETILSKEEVLRRYAEEGFRKGAARAFDDVKRPSRARAEASKEKLDFYHGTRQEFLRSAFARPVAVEKIELLAGRVFTDLNGVTEAMATAMSRTLTDGLVQGKGPREVARDLAEDVDGIGRARALTIARTETIRAHAEGQLDAMEQLGVEEVGVAVEWSTAGDELVCPLCEPLEGVVLTLEEATGMLPRHPNCRCAWIPANVGEDSDSQKDTKAQIQSAIRISSERGGYIDEEEGGVWGPGTTISRSRPESVLGNLALDRFSELFLNAFCPTGAGGGVDPTCSPSESGSSWSKAGSLEEKIAAIREMPTYTPEAKEIAVMRPEDGRQLRSPFREADPSIPLKLGLKEIEGLTPGEKDVTVSASLETLSPSELTDLYSPQTSVTEEKLLSMAESGKLRKSTAPRFVEAFNEYRDFQQTYEMTGKLLSKEILTKKRELEKKMSRSANGTVTVVEYQGRRYLKDGNHRATLAVMLNKPLQVTVIRIQDREVFNAFCPTGPGGGMDNSCPPKGGGGRGPAYVADTRTDKAKKLGASESTIKEMQTLARRQTALGKKIKNGTATDDEIKEHGERGQKWKELYDKAEAEGITNPEQKQDVKPTGPKTPKPETPKPETSKDPTQALAKAESLREHHRGHLYDLHDTPDLTTEQKQEYEQAFNSVLNEMPAAALEAMKISKTSWHRSTKEVTEEFSRRTGITTEASSVAGFYGMYDHTMALDGKVSEHVITRDTGFNDPIAGVYAHEMTHALDHGFKLSSTEEWRDAFFSEILPVDKEVTWRHRLSSYAATSKHEGMAEFGRLIYSGGSARARDSRRKMAEKRFPKATAFFKSRGLWPDASQGSKNLFTANVSVNSFDEAELEELFTAGGYDEESGIIWDGFKKEDAKE